MVAELGSVGNILMSEIVTEDQVQAKMAELKKAPRHVQAAALWSLIFGIVVVVRFLATAYADRISFGRATFYGLLMVAWFWFNGFSLYSRSKWGFIAVAGFALLPFVGVLSLSVHLLRLVLEGSLAADWSDTILSIVGIVQLGVTFLLFRHLLSKETREHVWKRIAEPGAAPNGGPAASVENSNASGGRPSVS